MRAWWAWVVDELGHREVGTSLALWRAAVGFTVAGELWLTWARGAVDLLWRTRAYGGLRAEPTADHWLWGLLDPDSLALDGVFWATTLAAVLVGVGLGTRAAALVALFGVQALFALSPGAGGGHDRMFTIALSVLVLATSDRTLSLGCRLRTGAWTSGELVPRWPRVVITWNLALIYASAGVVKLAAEWLPTGNFRAVYNMMLTPTWVRADWSWLMGPLFPLTQVGTVVTVLWEMTWLAVPFWLLLRARPRTGWRARVAAWDVRSAYVAVGVVMHGTLWLMANLGPFSPITIGWYLVLYTPDEFAAAWRRVTAGRAAAASGA